jgi:aspartate/methionine/tyrosine aminotransferase
MLGIMPRMQKFEPFQLEAWQSRWEQTVEYNLADSGVRPVRLDELVGDGAERERLLATELHYPPVGGTERLRALIAAWHDGAGPSDVLVTVGAAEANAIAVATLVGPGDHVVAMEPSYRQVRGCALNAGASVDAFPLHGARGWRCDLDALARAVTPRTRLIALANPNNPVGTILTEAEMDAVVAAAERVGAWILADEVYRGCERLTDRVTPSFFGRYERLVCVGSLSKAFGLPGLRTGWLVAPPAFVEDAWRRHEYATISTGMLSMRLAELALAPDARDRLLRRTRALIRDGYDRLQRWVDASRGLVSIVPPDATALGFVRVHLDAPSVEVADAIRTRAGVLVAPGAHFGVEGHLRITHGIAPEYLEPALERVATVLDAMRGR